jgi:hypothetical protein
MLVKTHRNGRDHLGLNIGTANARRYFRKSTPTIDLRLDDLEIQCPLPPDFWDGRPEIHDPRLNEWLAFKVGRGPSGRDPMLLTMVPSGPDTFVVIPKTGKRTDAFGAEISAPREVKSKSYFPVARVPVLVSRSVA